MQEVESYRLHVSYPKPQSLAFLGHLELIGTLEKSIRRSGLPFVIGNGFARRLKVQFCSSLPVGVASYEEFYDVFLQTEIKPQTALAMLQEATPVALAPYAAQYVQKKLASLDSWYNAFTWEAKLDTSTVSVEKLQKAIDDFLACDTFTYLRGDKEKNVNIDKTLGPWTLDDEGVLRFTTYATHEAALPVRPFVDALYHKAGCGAQDTPFVLITRIHQEHFE